MTPAGSTAESSPSLEMRESSTLLPTSVLYVGDLNPFTRSEQRYRALQSLGVEVTGISYAPITPGAGESPTSLWGRIRSRIGRPLDLNGVNRAIVNQASRRRYDLLWIDKAPPVRDATLRAVRELSPGMTLLFHSDDDMASRHNQSVYFREVLPQFDVVVTAKSFNAAPEELPAQGARRVVFEPQAYDPAFHRPVDVDVETRRRLGGEVGFIGTFEQDRAERMLFLARNGVPVRVFGNGWEGWVRRHPKLIVENRPVYGEEYIQCLSATDINLGFLRKSNRDLHTSRTLDIPACGAFYLAERTAEQQALFAEGIEADYFDSDSEMLDKVHYYLASQEERRRVASAGRERCARSGYDHPAALRRILTQALEKT